MARATEHVVTDRVLVARTLISSFSDIHVIRAFLAPLSYLVTASIYLGL